MNDRLFGPGRQLEGGLELVLRDDVLPSLFRSTAS
jgi:hypothetical protein